MIEIPLQFLGIKWKDGAPNFLVARGTELEYLDIPATINLTKTNVKKCVGYYDLAARCHMPCPSQIDFTGTDMSQCAHCQNSNGFGMCLSCNGDSCRADNPRGRAFCDQEHLVYLAYFPGRFKVGTAAAYRGLKRLYEQGALFSVFFASAPNGQIARRIEQAVNETGIAKNVSTSYKIANLAFDRGLDIIKLDLVQKLNELRPKISADLAKYFTDPKYNIFADIYQNLTDCLIEVRTKADLFGTSETVIKNYDRIIDATEIIGNVRAIIGGLIVIDNNGKLSVISMKNWEGFKIKFEK